MDNWIALGLILLILGAGTAIFANEKVQNQQSVIDKAERAVSEDAQQEYQMWSTMVGLGSMIGMIGFAMFIWRAAWTA